FSFAEAVDAENRTVKLKDKPLNWGGTTQLCTRESKFRPTSRAIVQAAALPRPASSRSISPVAARRCALRCRDGIHTQLSSPAKAGDPVFQRRQCQNREAAAYSIARSSRAMTAGQEQ